MGTGLILDGNDAVGRYNWKTCGSRTVLPVLDREAGYAGEFPHVVRDQNRASRSCMGRDQQVVVAYGAADPLQFTPDHPVKPIRSSSLRITP